MGNTRDRTGYSCMMKALVDSYRAAWSVVPGTTDPLFPIGVVTIADGSEEGWGYSFAQLHWAQTGSYGTLPNAAMPNTFLGDAWDAGDVSSRRCLRTCARACARARQLPLTARISHTHPASAPASLGA
jgi:hypothetical protein